jgi:hypothetical protein
MPKLCLLTSLLLRRSLPDVLSSLLLRHCLT